MTRRRRLPTGRGKSGGGGCGCCHCRCRRSDVGEPWLFFFLVACPTAVRMTTGFLVPFGQRCRSQHIRTELPSVNWGNQKYPSTLRCRSDGQAKKNKAPMINVLWIQYSNKVKKSGTCRAKYEQIDTGYKYSREKENINTDRYTNTQKMKMKRRKENGSLSNSLVLKPGQLPWSNRGPSQRCTVVR